MQHATALIVALVGALMAADSAYAQRDPAQMKEWGAMYRRMDQVTHPYQVRLGLASYWGTYCLDKTNDADAAHPKDGSTPLGITDWRVLSHDEFKTNLSILEDYRTAELMLCLADVKARLRAAER